MELYEEAVDLALKIDHLVLAKRSANLQAAPSARKKLWLRIARRVIQRDAEPGTTGTPRARTAGVARLLSRFRADRRIQARRVYVARGIRPAGERRPCALFGSNFVDAHPALASSGRSTNRCRRLRPPATASRRRSISCAPGYSMWRATASAIALIWARQVTRAVVARWRLSALSSSPAATRSAWRASRQVRVLRAG